MLSDLRNFRVIFSVKLVNLLTSTRVFDCLEIPISLSSTLRDMDMPARQEKQYKTYYKVMRFNAVSPATDSGFLRVANTIYCCVLEIHSFTVKTCSPSLPSLL